MIKSIFLITALSLDAFSFGLAQGFKNNKIKILYIFTMAFISTLLFFIPLILSQYIFQYFDKYICNIVNGFILILLGLYYLIKYFLEKNCKNNTKNVKNNKFCLKFCILSTFPISLDAIFTALLNGYTMTNITFITITYFLFTFFAILLSNFISLNLSNKSNYDLSWLSGLIFIFIGLLKSFGI